ncbi:hypothetical protein GCK72_021381 [Caenorhabditis remanei]|uniref:F-box domain-containing protein n=1 Tax=Caenorhabditis remanei TaxID=31234 RepID=A0A6A5GI02_CAERE|nr:hypothetical protein GCK72_021381 [Caenorhabditis remanei]KAF1754817.1 hypothetical protein GCK72_021381 [Caenorhabditis remanei]
MSPSFLEIPDVPMEKIMNNLDYIAIQSVRKTCWDLRNFIDDKKPGIGMKQINCETLGAKKLVFFAPFFGLPNVDFNLTYEGHGNGCRISLKAISGSKIKFVENLNHLDAVFHDFKVALNSQKPPFERITVNTKYFFEKFEEVMKSQKPFATESIVINAGSQELARQIIQHADPKYLKSIEYYNAPITIIWQYRRGDVTSNKRGLSARPDVHISIFQNFLQFHEYDKYLWVLKEVRENLFINAFGASFESLGEIGKIWYFNVNDNKEKVLKHHLDCISFENDLDDGGGCVDLDSVVVEMFMLEKVKILKLETEESGPPETRF